MKGLAETKKGNLSEISTRRGVGFVVGALVMLASSSMLLHEAASWMLDVGMMFGELVNLRAFSCNAHSLGLVFGYALTQISSYKLKILAVDLRFWLVFYLIQIANVVLFYGMLGQASSVAGMVAVQFVGAASGAVFFVVCSQVASLLDTRTFLLSVMLVLAGTTVIVQGVFGTLEAGVSLAAMELAHGGMVVASAVCMAQALRPGSCLRQVYEKDRFLPLRSEAREKGKPAPFWCLFAIVGVYAGVFGFMHVVPLAIPLGVFSRAATFLLGLVAALVLFAVTVQAQGDIKVSRIWNRFYRFVFPVVVVAALLGPLTASSEFLPALVMQAWALYYFDALLATACYAICCATKAAPSHVFARAFLIRSVGFLAGNLLGMTVHDSLVLGTAEYSIIGTIEFVLLVLVTFNMNSERHAKTVWGLLPREDPRGKYEHQLADRCKELAELNDLTAREAEVLSLLVRERRPKEISEELVVSVATVRSHVQAIYQKTGVHSHDELMRLVGKRHG